MSSSEPMTSAPAASASRAFALGEDGDTDGLAGTVGQRDGATDVLIGLTGVNAEAEVNFDGLVELGGVELLDELSSLKGV